MRKFRYHSLLGLCLISLFSINCLLVGCTLLLDQPLLSVFAILISLLQIPLHLLFFKKVNVWGVDSLRSLVNQCFNSRFLKFRSLFREEKVFIKRRSTNRPTQLVYETKSDQVYEHEYSVAYEKDEPMFDRNLKTRIGTNLCRVPYLMSVFNAGVPSSNTLPVDTVFSLSEAAKIEGFAVATGVSGIRPEHIRGGGDLLWQYRLDYYKIRNFANSQEESAFIKNSSRPYIKMIELFVNGSDTCKYSMGRDEPSHPNFQETPDDGEKSVDNFCEILGFVKILRDTSGGKPIGIRIPFKNAYEVATLSLAIKQAGVYPDFLTIDEELCNKTFHLKNENAKIDGLSLLAFTKSLFIKNKIPSALIFSGKVVTEFDILKAVSLGASACISTYPMAYASQYANSLFSKSMYSKSMRVANFYRNTLSATVRLMELCRYRFIKDLAFSWFYHNSHKSGFDTQEDIYIIPDIKKGFPPIINN